MPQSKNVPGKPDFKQLWPTQFMSISLPGHDTANPVLADHLLSQNALSLSGVTFTEDVSVSPRIWLDGSRCA